MISAFAEGFRVTGDPRYLEAATRAAGFLRAQLVTADGKLLRTFRAGKAHLDAYLEDYAYLAAGLLDLYEAGGDASHLREAERLTGHVLADFAAEDGGFYSTARGHEPLIVRHREGHDGATPAANAVAAHTMARLSYHLDRADLREQAVAALRAWGKAIARQPRAFTTSLAAADLLLEGPVELALVGTAGDPGRELLRAELARHYLPNRIVALHDPAAGASDLPLLAGKAAVGGRAALYVCRNFACQRPVTDPGDVASALEAGVRSPEDAPRGGLAPAILGGAASAEATSALAQRSPFAATGYTTLGKTGLVCSRLGFGGYRVDDETPAHHQALLDALRGGVNLVDTSTNYTEGASERLFGQALGEIVRGGERRREELIVVSKIGYVQGENLERAQEREAAGRPLPEVVKYGEGVWHCIHPEFLADQLTRSLARLGIETLDVCLLHNPEYFLMDAHERSYGTLDRRRRDFYARLAASFGFLEEQVRAGRIRAYGVSSNTAARPANDPEATSLTRMLEAAREAGGAGHHFRVLQLPLNLFESGAVLERSDGPDAKQTVLDVARAAGVGVLVNRPLNAMVNDGLVRLAAVSVPAPAVDLAAQLEALAALEAEYRTGVASHLEAGEGGIPPSDFFRWSGELGHIAPEVQGLEHWSAIESQRVLPLLGQALQALDRHLTGELGEQWHAWRARYVPEVQKALGELRRLAAEKSRVRATRLEAVIDPLLPAERRKETLSRKALWVVASTPGVSGVLAGLRDPEYVRDALAVLSWPPLADPSAVFRAVRAESPRP
jgi:aryl-alcohol dehydrogenase-like predicted oxidoreductase